MEWGKLSASRGGSARVRTASPAGMLSLVGEELNVCDLQTGMRLAEHESETMGLLR